MFQRAAFLGQVKIASPLHRPPAFSRRLGGMLEDYNNEINALKDKLSRLQKPYMQPAPPPSLFPAAPPYRPSTPPPTPTGQIGCYTRADGSGYWGYPEPGAVANNLPETWCRGLEAPKPLEPSPPPPITSEVDLPGTGMPPISVYPGEEVPPPVPIPPQVPGGHAPVSTGIPTGEYGQPPLRYWPPPTEEEQIKEECPRDTVWAAPGDTCPPGMEKTVPGSNCCYKSVASVPQSPAYGSWYGPTGFQGTAPVDLTTSAQNFSSVAFGAEGAMTAPSFVMSGRRRYPVVNLRHPRRI